MYPANPDFLQKPLAQTIPCIGGLDLASPKVQVNPGSLQECMNYEVGKESGYQSAPGLLRWNGTVNSAVTRYYVADYDDTNAGANVLYPGGQYTIESDLTGTTATIQVVKYDTANNKLYFVILDGDWAEPVRYGYGVTSAIYATSAGTAYGVKRDGS